MHELKSLALPLAAGLALGAAFFGGLWWTVTRGLASRRPALWFFGSLVLRTSIVMGGFVLVGSESWDRWLTCLLGFVAARVIVRFTCTAETPCAP